MELFAAAGIELPPSGGRARRAPSALVRSLRVPLFNYKVVEEALGLAAFAPTPDEVAAAADYARKVNSPRFLKQKETAVRPVFIEQIRGSCLGYTTLDPERPFSLAFEHPIRRGAVDVGLGSFNEADGSDRLVAPFELKGPETKDLDRIIPAAGEARSNKHGNTPTTRRARNGCWCRTASRSGSMASDGAARPMKSST